MLTHPTPQQMQSFASVLAREKFAPYRRVFGGDTRQGTQLFLLDGALAGAFHELLRILELTMRESMHREFNNNHVAYPKDIGFRNYSNWDANG